jgi:Rrf2 family protein
MAVSKISNRSRYAILALVELARASKGELLTISQIAQRQQIPARFLESILRNLKKERIVDSVRGNAGGYFLSIEPAKLGVGQIVIALEATAEAATQSSASSCDKLIDTIYSEARSSFYSVLDSTTLSDLVRKLESSESAITYVI